MDITFEDLVLGKGPNQPTSEPETDIDSAIEPAVESSADVPTIKNKAPVPDGVPVVKSVDTSRDIPFEVLLL